MTLLRKKMSFFKPQTSLSMLENWRKIGSRNIEFIVNFQGSGKSLRSVQEDKEEQWV